MVLTCVSVHEILVHRSTKSYLVVLLCGAVYYVVKCSSRLEVFVKPCYATIQMTVIEQYFHVVLFIYLNGFLVDRILVCGL